MAVYDCDMGDPLDMLVEECCEVIQAVMKFRRFHNSGVDLNPTTALTSQQQVIQEIGDVLAVIEILASQSNALEVDKTKLEEAKIRKLDRLRDLFGFRLC